MLNQLSSSHWIHIYNDWRSNTNPLIVILFWCIISSKSQWTAWPSKYLGKCHIINRSENFKINWNYRKVTDPTARWAPSRQNLKKVAVFEELKRNPIRHHLLLPKVISEEVPWSVNPWTLIFIFHRTVIAFAYLDPQGMIFSSIPTDDLHCNVYSHVGSGSSPKKASPIAGGSHHSVTSGAVGTTKTAHTTLPPTPPGQHSASNKPQSPSNKPKSPSHKPQSPSASQAAAESPEVTDYSHYNSKLTIQDFDLLKVSWKVNFHATWTLSHCRHSTVS